MPDRGPSPSRSRRRTAEESPPHSGLGSGTVWTEETSPTKSEVKKLVGVIWVASLRIPPTAIPPTGQAPLDDGAGAGQRRECMPRRLDARDVDQQVLHGRRVAAVPW